MKKSIPLILSLLGSLLLLSFLAWSLSLHGIAELYRVNSIYHRLVFILGLFSLGLLVLALLYQWRKSRAKSNVLTWLSKLIIILSIPAIIIPLAAFVYVNDTFSSGIGSTPPQLIIADGTGAYGVPDLAIAFNTEITNTNTLTWGQGGKSTVLSEDIPTKNHAFLLTDLEPGSTYWYRLNDEVDISFTTPPLDDSLHFAVASDMHLGAGDARNDLTSEMLTEISDPINDFDMFFILGDLVEYGFRNNQWNEAFNTLSPTTSVIPTRFAVGNHDTLFSGFGKYQSYCYPQGMELQTGSRLWYRIDVGKVHFLILDLEWNAESFTAIQAAWLETQLEDIPTKDWKIVMSHSFYYSSGSVDYGWKWYDNPETINRLTPIFAEYGVHVVFSGHNHHLELLQNSGIDYVICGSFGGRPDIERTYISPSSLWYMSGQYGFVDVTINGNQCSLDFRDSDFNIIKTFTVVQN